MSFHFSTFKATLRQVFQVTILLVFVSPAFAAQGDLDPTFDTDGKVITDFAGGADLAYAVARQADGKIIAAGTAFFGTYDFGLVRYNTDGSLDTTFNADGKVTTNFGTAADAANAVAVQLDGKIVAAGLVGLGNNVYNFALARYNTDGTLDATFDGDGKVTTAIGSVDDRIYAIALQPDGKIVVAGFAWTGSSYDFALARYNANGSLDTTFGNGGKVTTSFGTGSDDAFAVAVQTDGRIVAAGTASISGNGFDFALARYNSDGSLDTTFGSGGKVTTGFGTGRDEAFAMVLQPDGKIVTAGHALAADFQLDFALVRYNTDGSLDTSFDGDGKVTTPIGTGTDDAFAVALQPNGKIVAAGRAGINSNFEFALTRYNTNGSLDTTFGSGGRVVTNVTSSFYDEIYAMLVQPDGRIIVAGRVGDGAPTDFALARYIGDTPPAATAIISGRITNAQGQGIGTTALLTLTGGNLTEPLYARATPAGYYRFEAEIGQTYTVTPVPDERTFTPVNRIVVLTENVFGVDFITQ